MLMEQEIEGKLACYKTLSDIELCKELGLSLPENLDIQAVSPILNKINLWSRETLIYAMTIGDGSISPRGVLTIEHGYKDKAFVEFKYLCLKNAGFLAPGCQIARNVRYSKSSKTFSVSWRFGTSSIFKEERQEFYPPPEKKKIIPTGLLERLTPGIVAFWYMDDGGKSSNTPMGMVLDVSAFSESQKLLAQAAIADLFDIDVSRYNQTSPKGASTYTKLNFKRRNIENLIDQIKPFFIPNLLFKLPKSP